MSTIVFAYHVRRADDRRAHDGRPSGRYTTSSVRRENVSGERRGKCARLWVVGGGPRVRTVSRRQASLRAGRRTGQLLWILFLVGAAHSGAGSRSAGGCRIGHSTVAVSRVSGQHYRGHWAVEIERHFRSTQSCCCSSLAVPLELCSITNNKLSSI